MYQAVYLKKKFEQNAAYQSENNFKYEVHIIDDDEGYIVKEFKPYAYKLDPDGEYITLFG